MMSVFEAAWVIARRDFIATVYSRSFILFLLAPMLMVVFVLGFSRATGEAERAKGLPVVAVVTDSATAEALAEARAALVAGTNEQAFPALRNVAPAENVRVQARALLADQEQGYSGVLSGTLERPLLTGPARIDEWVGARLQLMVDQARHRAALEAAGRVPAATPVARELTEQAAGNLQSIRRDIARVVQGIIFTITILLATMLLSTIAEEKTSKVIEVLAAAVPLDAIFLGKLIAMLGISFVGLSIWSGVLVTGYLFVNVLQDWLALPQVAPAVGWPAYIALGLLYYGTNYMVLGALFLGIGAQASNIREIQTITMPITILQLLCFLLASQVVGSEGGLVTWLAYLLPFSSPLAMIAFGAESALLWPHLLALLWQVFWLALIIRLSSRIFRATVLKSGSAGGFWGLGRARGAG